MPRRLLYSVRVRAVTCSIHQQLKKTVRKWHRTANVSARTNGTKLFCTNRTMDFRPSQPDSQRSPRSALKLLRPCGPASALGVRWPVATRPVQLVFEGPFAPRLGDDSFVGRHRRRADVKRHLKRTTVGDINAFNRRGPASSGLTYSEVRKSSVESAHGKSQKLNIR